jgi:hypothetical protein
LAVGERKMKHKYIIALIVGVLVPGGVVAAVIIIHRYHRSAARRQDARRTALGDLVPGDGLIGGHGREAGRGMDLREGDLDIETGQRDPPEAS